MRYIGPFFRMNSLSEKEIYGQLFYFSKEAVKTIVLQSKCGLVSPIKNYNKLSSSIDITTNGNFSPLLCIYRKASPNFIHSRNSNGFDEDTFKKEINPSTNALMTLCLLELSDYYRSFENVDNNSFALYHIYKSLTKDQLEFYSVNLRNSEGVFIDKKNILENNSKNFNLVDKDKKFKFSDQSFMMVAYSIYALKNPDDEISKSYDKFSDEILKMFCDYKDKLYDCSLDEISKVLLSLNILYSYKKSTDLKNLIIDLSDFTISKLDEKDYYIDSLDTVALCSLVFTLSYKHTKILTFSEKSSEIINRLSTLYDENKGSFYKLSSKKELKYSCLDITFYLLAFIVYDNAFKTSSEHRNMLSSIYKKFVINSGIISSWPNAPTLDDYERYRGLSLNSNDMMDESYFRMPSIPTPDSSGIAPIFNKSINYNRRKDTFSNNKVSFDSYKNFLNFYLIIHLFKDEYMNEMRLSSLLTDCLESTSSTELTDDTITDNDRIDNNESSDQTLLNPFSEEASIENNSSIQEDISINDHDEIITNNKNCNFEPKSDSN